MSHDELDRRIDAALRRRYSPPSDAHLIASAGARRGPRRLAALMVAAAAVAGVLLAVATWDRGGAGTRTLAALWEAEPAGSPGPSSEDGLRAAVAVALVGQCASPAEDVEDAPRIVGDVDVAGTAFEDGLAVELAGERVVLLVADPGLAAPSPPPGLFLHRMEWKGRALFELCPWPEPRILGAIGLGAGQ